MNQSNYNPRKDRYIFSVYVIPIFTTLSICGLGYLLSEIFSLDKLDKFLSYVMGLSLGGILFIINRLKWLILPDGTYIQTRKFYQEYIEKKNGTHSNFAEPPKYIAKFSMSIFSFAIFFVSGLALIVLGILTFSKTKIFLPIIEILAGVFMFYFNYRNIVNYFPEIKTASTGLWTKKLGYRPWSSISRTEINFDKDGKSTHAYLEIYLNGSDFSFPADSILLNDIYGKDKIKLMIDELCKK